MLNALTTNDWISASAVRGPQARVLVVVGNDLTRAGLRPVLAALPGLERVGEAFDAQHGLDLARRLAPDILLLDVDLGQADGFAGVRALGQTHPSVRVLIVSMFAELDVVLDAIRAGAAGCLRPGADLAETQRAISAVLRGELAVDTRMATEAVRRLATPQRRSTPGTAREQGDACPLSPREQEVLELLARGYSNREIAHDLVITAHTAKVHVEHILAKLKVRCRTEAAVKAIEFGYITA